MSHLVMVSNSLDIIIDTTYVFLGLPTFYTNRLVHAFHMISRRSNRDFDKNMSLSCVRTVKVHLKSAFYMYTWTRGFQ